MKGVVKEDTKEILRWFSDNKGVKNRKKKRKTNNVIYKKSAGQRKLPVMANPFDLILYHTHSITLYKLVKVSRCSVIGSDEEEEDDDHYVSRS